MGSRAVVSAAISIVFATREKATPVLQHVASSADQPVGYEAVPAGGAGS